MSKRIVQRKVNKYLQEPAAKLDLHGCNRREAEGELTNFFNHWIKQGGGVKLLVITGQGWHSADGQGVLQPFTVAWLKDRGYRQRLAKPKYGGKGAIEVDLPIS
jgi:DNA-nicking Smr family endonuclease